MELLTSVLWISCVLSCAVANTDAAREVEDGATTFFQETWHIGAVAGAGSLLLVIVLIIFAASCCCCYKRRTCCFKRTHEYILEKRPLISHYRPPDALYTSVGPAQVEVSSKRSGRRQERTVGEEMRRQKEQQEQNDRVHAKSIVSFCLRNERKYELVMDFPDMGSRMLKYWFKIADKEGKEHLLTIAPVSQKCPLTLDSGTMKTMNRLMQQLSHPNLHPVREVTYISEHHQVILLQPFCRAGTLKDYIYRSTPTTEWTRKYSRRSRGLNAVKVALYGRQMLEGLVYLYGHGFPALGHIQTGNVFVEGDVCRLGGYENTLLGYKTRLYKLCKECMEDMDLIMFGHVIFEMACGFELTEAVPAKEEYRSVKDHEVRDVLLAIFDKNDEGAFTSSIEEIYNHQFFQAVHLPIQKGARSDHAHFSSDIKSLLAKVTKNKPRTQKSLTKKKKRQQDQGAQRNSSQAPPTATPKVGVAGTSQPNAESRNAVMVSIRGEQPGLKKTQTNDRSAPRLEH